jgi:hypothetical protein
VLVLSAVHLGDHNGVNLQLQSHDQGGISMKR